MPSDTSTPDAYEPPAITEIAGVHELTLIIQKHDHNTPDGYEYNGIILTS